MMHLICSDEPHFKEDLIKSYKEQFLFAYLFTEMTKYGFLSRDKGELIVLVLASLVGLIEKSINGKPLT
jgi:hypothetical protein